MHSFLLLASMALLALVPTADAGLRRKKQPEIPRIIWTYWDKRQVPQFVEDCVEGFRKHGKADGFMVNFVREDTIGDFIDFERDPLPKNFYKAKEKAHQADWVRLALLKQHGGIWMDASSVMTRSPIWAQQIQQHQKVDGVLFFNHGYHQPGWQDFKMHENWYIAAVKGAAFVSDWLAELNVFFDVGEANGAKYIRHLKDTYGEEAFLRMKGGPVRLMLVSILVLTFLALLGQNGNSRH